MPPNWAEALQRRCVPAAAAQTKAAEAASAIEWAHKASLARCKPVYATSHSKGMITQLQAQLALLDAPNEEMRLELKGQMAPEDELLDKLRDEVVRRKAELSEKREEGEGDEGGAVERQRAANLAARKEREAEISEVKDGIESIKDQIRGVKSGEKQQEAMATLKRSIAEEAESLRKQVEGMRERKAKDRKSVV